MGARGLDAVDRRILRMLAARPEVAQGRLGEIVGLSQSSVSERLARLAGLGFVGKAWGFDPVAAGLVVGAVSVRVRDADAFAAPFMECPYFLGGMRSSGDSNLILFFAAEDLATVECVVDRHIRLRREAERVEFQVVTETLLPVRFPLRPPLPAPRCSCRCENCAGFASGRCLGCPSSPAYRGRFWGRDSRGGDKKSRRARSRQRPPAAR